MEQFANNPTNAQNTLATSVSASTTTIVVNSAKGFPAVRIIE